MRRTPPAVSAVIAVIAVIAVAALSTTTTTGTATADTRLPESTTHTTLSGLPADGGGAETWSGTVLHPVGALPLHAHPTGPAVGTVPGTQLGNPTWLPVIQRQPGWARVLLPSRPNASTGWVPVRTGAVRLARTPYLIQVDRGARRLTILKDGRVTGSWPVAVGAAKTPTPLGRTFLLALLSTPDKSRDKSRKGQKVILPTGSHSNTLDSYGGGPGTVAFHGWPNRSVFGKAVSHGCVRTPKAALRALTKVPIGTLVVIKR